MPVKSNTRKKHHSAHPKERRSKHFLKVYAPYIPLLLIVGCGIFISASSEFKNRNRAVESYSTNTSVDGLLEETNKQREKQSLPTLRSNEFLNSAAQSKAQDMASRDYWSHNTPDGKEPWTFIDGTAYTYRKASENLAYGFDSNRSTINGWMNSEGHRTNMLAQDVQEVGFGIVHSVNYLDKGPQTIVVALYADPTNVAGASTAPVTTTRTPQSISYIQSVTAGKAPWSGFVAGLVMGSIVMYLVVKHARQMRRAFVRSERFIAHHPLFDVTLVALVALTFVINQNIGTIY